MFVMSQEYFGRAEPVNNNPHRRKFKALQCKKKACINTVPKWAGSHLRCTVAQPGKLFCGPTSFGNEKVKQLLRLQVKQEKNQPSCIHSIRAKSRYVSLANALVIGLSIRPLLKQKCMYNVGVTYAGIETMQSRDILAFSSMGHPGICPDYKRVADALPRLQVCS